MNIQQEIMRLSPEMSGFSLSLENTAVGSGTRTARLFAPESEALIDLEGRPLYVTDGAFLDTSSNAGLVASGYPNNISVLNSFIRRNPCMIGKMFITTTDAKNFQYPLIKKSISPFTSQAESTPIRLFKPGGEYRIQDTEISITEEIYLSDQEYLEVTVMNESALNFHFEFTYTRNAAAAFKALVAMMKNYQI